ncbi:Inorganic phosphate transport protein PHO88 [Diplonema papillatum]|nr:Inorganic phosphate transport protein PHO88 [Diplonema papillatum]|eukprot:gene1440-2218_t
MAASAAQMLKVGAVITAVRMLDFEDPQNLMYLRIVYVTVQSLCWLVMLAIFVSIKLRKDRTVLKVYETTPFGTEVPGDEQKVVTTTVEQYHTSQLLAMAVSLGASTAIVGFIHLKWALCPPLCMQSMMNPETVYSHQLFSIHILRQDPAKFPIPWTKPNPMDFSSLTQDAGADEKKVKKEKELGEMRAANEKAVASHPKKE